VVKLDIEWSYDPTNKELILKFKSVTQEQFDKILPTFNDLTYDPTNKEAILKFKSVDQEQFSKILHALNDLTEKGEIVEGEYRL